LADNQSGGSSSEFSVETVINQKARSYFVCKELPAFESPRKQTNGLTVNLKCLSSPGRTRCAQQTALNRQTASLPRNARAIKVNHESVESPVKHGGSSRELWIDGPRSGPKVTKRVHDWLAQSQTNVRMKQTTRTNEIINGTSSPLTKFGSKSVSSPRKRAVIKKGEKITASSFNASDSDWSREDEDDDDDDDDEDDDEEEEEEAEEERLLLQENVNFFSNHWFDRSAEMLERGALSDQETLAEQHHRTMKPIDRNVSIDQDALKRCKSVGALFVHSNLMNTFDRHDLNDSARCDSNDSKRQKRCSLPCESNKSNQPEPNEIDKPSDLESVQLTVDHKASSPIETDESTEPPQELKLEQFLKQLLMISDSNKDESETDEPTVQREPEVGALSDWTRKLIHAEHLNTFKAISNQSACVESVPNSLSRANKRSTSGAKILNGKGLTNKRHAMSSASLGSSGSTGSSASSALISGGSYNIDLLTISTRTPSQDVELSNSDQKRRTAVSSATSACTSTSGLGAVSELDSGYRTDRAASGLKDNLTIVSSQPIASNSSRSLSTQVHTSNAISTAIISSKNCRTVDKEVTTKKARKSSEICLKDDQGRTEVRLRTVDSNDGYDKNRKRPDSIVVTGFSFLCCRLFG
jgi:hypothetical protein